MTKFSLASKTFLSKDAETHQEINNLTMPLVAHLIELRRRLIYALGAFLITFCVAYAFSDQIFLFLVRPLIKLFAGEGNRRLIYTGLTEAFVTYIKVAFFTAAFVSFPIIASQVWMFVAPGLYAREKRTFLPFLIATPILFLLGALFAYYMIIPNAWKFFLSFETPAQTGILPIQLEARINEYLSLVMQLILAFGFSFQLPVVLMLLVRIGVLSKTLLIKNRKYAFLIIMIVSAFLTPPDVLSMLGLAFPLYLLYEISLWMMHWVEKGNQSKVAL
jgi:sec-independent protein translocase protein TatC